MDESEGNNATNMAFSSQNMSPVVSKLIGRVIGKAFNEVTCAGDEGDNPDSLDNLLAVRSTHETRTPGVASVFPSDSTHVIVPIQSNPMPDESKIRVGTSFIHRHTIPIESEAGINIGEIARIHSNKGGLELDLVQVDSKMNPIDSKPHHSRDEGEHSSKRDSAATNSSQGRPRSSGSFELSETGDTILRANEDRNSGPESPPSVHHREPSGDSETVIGENGSLIGAGFGLSPSTPPIRPATAPPRFDTLIDEMSSQVAEVAIDGMINPLVGNRGFLEQAYEKFSNVAKAAARITAYSRVSSGGGRGVGGPPRPATSGGTRGNVRLPPEVQERILNALSEIKAQLDQVKTQLR